MTREDLVIHKLLKLRTDRSRVLHDLADLRCLVGGEVPIDRAYVDGWIDPPEKTLLDALATEDDETLLRRLTSR